MEFEELDVACVGKKYQAQQILLKYGHKAIMSKRERSHECYCKTMYSVLSSCLLERISSYIIVCDLSTAEIWVL